MRDEAPTTPVLPLGFDPGPVTGSLEFAVVTPRRAVDPRGFVWSAEIWRLAQEAAVQGTVSLGWSPERLRAEGRAFVVSDMTVQHRRRVAYGERIRARTWIASARRGTLFTREIRLWSPQGPVAAVSQRWAHVAWDGPDAVRVCPAAPELLAAMSPVEGLGGLDAVKVPAVQREAGGARFGRTVQVWHTWMDPIGHVNHPAYLDFLEETLCDWVYARGGDPQRIEPISERIRFRQAATAPQEIRAELELVGRTSSGALVFDGRVHRPADGAELVRSTLVREVPQSVGLAAALRP
jgi:acyl-CoA thioesterase FadM